MLWYGYEELFARQAEGHLQPGDVFVVISTSGNSVIMLRAVEVAKRKEAVTVVFPGRDGGQIGRLVDYLRIVPASNLEL